MDATVHLCRHGEVDNPSGVLYTRLPGYHLSARGRAMADALGARFAGEPLTLLRTSPLERTRETLAPIAARHPHLEVGIDQRIIEADSLMQGLTHEERRALARDPRQWGLFRDPFRPSWGEPWTEIAARMLAAIADAAATVGPGGVAVLVSHQAPIWVARLAAGHRMLAHVPAMRQCALASVTTFRVDADGTPHFQAYEEPARDVSA